MADYSSKIIIHTGRLGTDAEKVGRCIRNMSDEMEKMKSSVAQMDRMWDGPGSEAFKQAFETDRRMFEEIIKNLRGIHDYETNAKSEYEKCENDVSALVAEIRV